LHATATGREGFGKISALATIPTGAADKSLYGLAIAVPNSLQGAAAGIPTEEMVLAHPANNNGKIRTANRDFMIVTSFSSMSEKFVNVRIPFDRT